MHRRGRKNRKNSALFGADFDGFEGPRITPRRGVRGVQTTTPDPAFARTGPRSDVAGSPPPPHMRAISPRKEGISSEVSECRWLSGSEMPPPDGAQNRDPDLSWLFKRSVQPPTNAVGEPSCSSGPEQG